MDISNPGAPQVIATVDLDQYVSGRNCIVHHVVCDGDRVYAAVDWLIESQPFDSHAAVVAIDCSGGWIYPLGQVDVPLYLDQALRSLAVRSQYVYVADGEFFRVLGFVGSVPSQWGVRASYSLGSGRARYVALHPDSGTPYAYVAAGVWGVAIMDVASPNSPALAGWYSPESSMYTTTVATSGADLFLGDGCTLRRASLTVPTAPVASGEITLSGCARALVVDGDDCFAVLGQSGLARILIESPATLSWLATADLYGLSTGACMIGGTLAAATTGVGFQVVDPAGFEPEQYMKALIGEGGFVEEVTVRGDLAFVAAGGNISTPASCDSPAATNPWRGLRVIDNSDSAEPEVLASLQVQGVGPPLAVVGGALAGDSAYLYLSCAMPIEDARGGYLATVAIADPGAPQVVHGPIPVPGEEQRIGGVAVAGDCLYVCADDLRVYSLADPAHPSYLTALDLGCPPRRIAVDGSRAYVASGHGLLVLDLSNPEQPSFLGALDLAGGTPCLAGTTRVRPLGCVVFLNLAATEQRGRLIAVDVRDASVPTILSEAEVPAFPTDFAITGHYAYLACGAKGIAVVDISDPADLQLAGRVSSQGITTAIAMTSQGGVLGSRGGPLHIIRVRCGDYAASTVRYDNRSGETGLDYPGTPYSSLLLDYTGDGRQDLFISIKEYGGRLYRQREYLSDHGAPQFEHRTWDDIVTSDWPPVGLRGLSAADYDNDGHIDFLAAANTGAKLYHYNATSGQFEDGSSAVVIQGLITQTWAGVWGDYDRDGQIDLFVCRGAYAGQDPEPDDIAAAQGYLLRNDLRGTGQFLNVTVPSGIAGAAPNAAVTATWVDVDGDHELDLYVGEHRNNTQVPYPHSLLFMNNGDGTFHEKHFEKLAGLPDRGISAVSAADVDNDGDPDLLIARQIDDPLVFLNDGLGRFPAAAAVGLDVGHHGSIGVIALDHDLDARLDVLVLPAEAGDHPWLFWSRPAGQGLAFLDQSSAVNLWGSTGRADGVAAADFNRDGDLDLFLGRPVESGKYFYRAESASYGDPPASDWTGVRLVAGPGNNRAAIGTKVKFHVPAAGFTQLHHLDGGSGRGGQNDNTLICGLGDMADPAEAVVTWPGGFSQTVTLYRKEITTVGDETVPTVVPNSARCSWVAIPGGGATVTFTWETQFSCDPSLDKVRIWDAVSNPPQCESYGTEGNPMTLALELPMVEGSVAAKVGGGYVHNLVWYGVDCTSPCVYHFEVESATDAEHVSTARSGRTLKFTVCVP